MEDCEGQERSGQLGYKTNGTECSETQTNIPILRKVTFKKFGKNIGIIPTLKNLK